MQVCWTLQNEYAFTVHIGGVDLCWGKRSSFSSCERWGIEKEDAGKALQQFPRQAADLIELSTLSVAAAHLPVCIYHNFKTTLILCCCTSPRVAIKICEILLFSVLL